MTIDWKIGVFSVAGVGGPQGQPVLIQVVRSGPTAHITETLQLQLHLPTDAGDLDQIRALALERLVEACRSLAEHPPTA